MRARRLLAIAVAAQAFPELRDAESDLAALARGALPRRGRATERRRGRRCSTSLSDDDLLPPAARALDDARRLVGASCSRAAC